MFSSSYVNTNPSWSLSLPCQFFSNRCASLQVDPIIPTFARSILSFFSTVFVSSDPSCLCFPALPPFSSRTKIHYSSILLSMGSLSILFRQCSYPVILRKILTELQVYHSAFFSSPVDSIQALSIISFLVSSFAWWFLVKMLRSYRCIILCSLFFSGGFNSSFQCWSYSFPRFKCFLMSVHLLIIHLLLFMFIWSAEGIPEDSCLYS